MRAARARAAPRFFICCGVSSASCTCGGRAGWPLLTPRARAGAGVGCACVLAQGDDLVEYEGGPEETAEAVKDVAKKCVQLAAMSPWRGR